QTTADATNLIAGTYNVTVTDNNNCTATTQATVTEPSALSVIINGTNESCSGSADGDATAVVNGGTTPYSYTWSNGGSTAGITNLTAGTYFLTVTDDNGCDITDQITIGQNATITTTISKTDIDCF